ncbi:MAG: hypothetical protein SFV54_07410 [Bryobacteraceae bacterium]|nr:hypothetical protein [Bryobacteraceae bacterium]
MGLLERSFGGFEEGSGESIASEQEGLANGQVGHAGRPEWTA